MASPMREKRAWLTRDREAESKETAAFEATVAVARDTVAKSGEMLVSAKEDLTDYQGWLQKQAAALQADRARHERWIERQREHQEAMARREQARLRRQLMRERVVRAVKQTVMGAVLYLRSLCLLLIGTIASVLTYIARSIVGAVLGTGMRLRDLALACARYALLSLSWLGGLFLAGFAWVSAKFDAFVLRPIGNALGGAYSWSRARAEALAPELAAWTEKTGYQARRFAGGTAAGVQGIFGAGAGIGAYRPRQAVAARAGVQNALSSLTRARDADLSQMLIIAGTLLLVCGGLMLGGGLILRAGTPERVSPNAIAWWFEAPDQPLVHRVIFTLSGTPQSFRINGLLIHGENLSGQPLASVEGVVKPDARRPDIRLALDLDRPASEESSAAEIPVAPLASGNVIPPHAPFKLVFPFPAEAMEHEDGLTTEEFLDSYGGLTLNFRYVIDGKRRTLIQYLSPEMLRTQLDEVRATGS